MEVGFTRVRVLIFIVLLVGFFAWCYYSAVHVGRGSYFDAFRVNRALSYCMVVFAAGAFISCFGDFQYGMFPPKSLRPLIIVGGAVLMILAVALIYSMQRTIAPSSSTELIHPGRGMSRPVVESKNMLGSFYPAAHGN